jgi:hypothetical protein
MICYRYVSTVDPAAPFVKIGLRCPITGRQVEGLPALIDTAADRTVVPAPIIAGLNLEQAGHELFQGFGGQVVELPTYVVVVVIHDLTPITVKVALGEDEPYVLLGRDVLNLYRLVLDGPELTLEIG